MADNQSTLPFASEQSDIKSGIYQIRCVPTGKAYIGSATDFRSRWATHRCQLESETHHSVKLQRAWNKYGRESFAFEVLELVPPEKLLKVEQWYLDTYRTAGATGYNIAPTAGSMLGFRHSEATRQKLSELKKARPPVSAETREKLSSVWRGRKRTPESVQRSIETKRANGTHTLSEEAIARISATKTGHKHTAEARANMSASRRGKAFTPERCENISAGKRGKPFSAEHKAALAAARQGRKLSETHKANISAALKGRRRADKAAQLLESSESSTPA